MDNAANSARWPPRAFPVPLHRGGGLCVLAGRRSFIVELAVCWEGQWFSMITHLYADH